MKVCSNIYPMKANKIYEIAIKSENTETNNVSHILFKNSFFTFY